MPTYTIPQIPVTATSILGIDRFEISSAGISKQIAWSVILDTDNTWTGNQTFNSLTFLSAGESGRAYILGGGSGDMSINFQAVQGSVDDIRTGTEMTQPLARQGGISTFPGAAEHVIYGEGSGDGNPSPYTRIEYGWQCANPGWYSFHHEAGVMPDTIPAIGGLDAKPISFGIADHTNTQYNHHVMASSTDGPLVDDFTMIGGGIIPLSGNRTFVMGAWFFGIRPLASAVFGVAPILYQYDGTEQAYLQPPVPITSGFHDSHQIVWAGTWNAGGGASDYHTADWKWRVNVTNTSGVNKYILESRLDDDSYVSHMEIPFTIPVLATGAAHTVDDIITFLQGLKLCKQS